MAAVHIGDVGKQNKIDIDSNHVASTQGRKNTVTKLLKEAVEKEANGETAVYYWNKTEALSLAVESGLQLPGAHISDGLLRSIFDAGSPVNRKYLEQKETRQFKNWFDKSVVRNADDTPKKVYHGTDANFTVFEHGILAATWARRSRPVFFIHILLKSTLPVGERQGFARPCGGDFA